MTTGPLGKDGVHLGCHVKLFQTSPESLGARESVSFSPKMAFYRCNHEYDLAYGGRLIGNDRCLVHIAVKRLPLDVLEEDLIPFLMQVCCNILTREVSIWRELRTAKRC
jgi:hypothetical protein